MKLSSFLVSVNWRLGAEVKSRHFSLSKWNVVFGKFFAKHSLNGCDIQATFPAPRKQTDLTTLTGLSALIISSSRNSQAPDPNNKNKCLYKRKKYQQWSERAYIAGVSERRNDEMVAVWWGGEGPYFVDLIGCFVVLFWFLSCLIFRHSSGIFNQTVSPLKDGPMDPMHHHPNPSTCAQ